jgi:hypothetical protein
VTGLARVLAAVWAAFGLVVIANVAPAAAASPTWGPPQAIDTLDLGGITAPQGLDSVSCPSQSFCAAVDSDGRFVTFNGTSWSAPKAMTWTVPGLDDTSWLL